MDYWSQSFALLWCYTSTPFPQLHGRWVNSPTWFPDWPRDWSKDIRRYELSRSWTPACPAWLTVLCHGDHRAAPGPWRSRDRWNEPIPSLEPRAQGQPSSAEWQPTCRTVSMRTNDCSVTALRLSMGLSVTQQHCGDSRYISLKFTLKNRSINSPWALPQYLGYTHVTETPGPL